VLRRFLDEHKQSVEYICRPSRYSEGNPINARLKAAKWMLSKLVGGGICGSLVIDERCEERNSKMCDGPVFLAQASNSFLVPMVAKNRIELVLKRQWDKHRIPLWRGKIYFGNPIKIGGGRGKHFRTRETERIEKELDSLAKYADEEVKGWRFSIPI